MTDGIMKIDNIMEFNYNYTLIMPSSDKYKIDILGKNSFAFIYKLLFLTYVLFLNLGGFLIFTNKVLNTLA